MKTLRPGLLLFLLVVPAAAAAAEPMRPGIWKSVGYGEILVVADGRYTFYDVTRATCVERERGEIKADAPYFPSVRYPSPSRMVVEGSSYRYPLVKVDALPAACAATNDPTDSLLTFDAFWHTLDENYVGFAARGIDWKAVRETYRPRVTKTTSEAGLYATLGEIVATINDPHVFVSNRRQGAESVVLSTRDLHGIARAVESASPGREKAYYRTAARRIEDGIETLVRYEVLRGTFSTAFNDRLTWGWLEPGVAYLRASAFVGLFTGMKRDEMAPALEEALDRIFGDFAGARALVLDVSTNAGGAEFIPIAIARRLVREPKVGSTKRARTGDGLSEEAFTTRLEPSASIRFPGEVVVLMSNNTVSAGEVLPLVLRGLPHVTLAGETTPGAISDIQMKTLPNGAVLGLPNEVVTDASGENFDVRGIPPDVGIAVFEPRNPLSGYARTLAAAAALAREKAGQVAKSSREP